MEHRFEVFENAEGFFSMMRLVLGHNKHPEPIFLKLMTLPSKGEFSVSPHYPIILSGILKSVATNLIIKDVAASFSFRFSETDQQDWV